MGPGPGAAAEGEGEEEEEDRRWEKRLFAGWAGSAVAWSWACVCADTGEESREAARLKDERTLPLRAPAAPAVAAASGGWG